MANLALALAFAVSFLFSPGGQILRITIGKPLLQSLPYYQGHLLLALANYWIPAVLIYLVLRLIHADRWVRMDRKTIILFGLANTLLILFVSARTFASTIQGGGASYAVVSYGVFILWPALIMLVVGFVWLSVRSFRLRNELPSIGPKTFNIKEGLILSAALVFPIIIVATTLFFSENAPFGLAREAKMLFVERCKHAGEIISKTPQNVQSVYFDRDGSARFSKIVDGVYSTSGGGIIARPLVDGGWLLYSETRNNRGHVDGSTERYRKYVVGDWKGKPVDEITSEYGVYQKALIDKEESKRLQVMGTEVTIKNLRTNKVIAVLTYFTSRRHRTVCGQKGKSDLSVHEFIRRSLNLERRFPRK